MVARPATVAAIRILTLAARTAAGRVFGLVVWVARAEGIAPVRVVALRVGRTAARVAHRSETAVDAVAGIVAAVVDSARHILVAAGRALRTVVGDTDPLFAAVSGIALARARASTRRAVCARRQFARARVRVAACDVARVRLLAAGALATDRHARVIVGIDFARVEGGVRKCDLSVFFLVWHSRVHRRGIIASVDAAGGRAVVAATGAERD
jgi:hypothetical protein